MATLQFRSLLPLPGRTGKVLYKGSIRRALALNPACVVGALAAHVTGQLKLYGAGGKAVSADHSQGLGGGGVSQHPQQQPGLAGVAALGGAARSSHIGTGPPRFRVDAST